MTVFWIAVIGMSLLVMVVLLRAGKVAALNVRRSQGVWLARQASNVDAYRDRIDDLAASFAEGQIDTVTNNELLLELKQQLVDDAAELQTNDKSASKDGEFSPLDKVSLQRDRRLLFVAVIFIPLTAFILYFPFGASIGSYDQHRVVAVLSAFDQFDTAEQNKSGVERLQATLEWNTRSLRPDPQLLKLLGDVYRSQASYANAVATFEILLKSQPDDPGVMALLAEVLYLQGIKRHARQPEADGQWRQDLKGNVAPLSEPNVLFTPRITRLLEQALEVNPHQGNALSLRGVQAFQSADYIVAIDYWQRAVPLYQSGGAEWRTLQESIAAAHARAGIPVANVHADTGADDNTGAVVASIDKPATDQSIAAAVTVSVSIDRSQLTDTDANLPIFVFARAVSGSRMPLAARRLSLGDLPVTITLSERDKMAGRSIADVEQVVVGARLARSGQPVGAIGDLESAEHIVSVNQSINGVVLQQAEPVNLVIDHLRK